MTVQLRPFEPQDYQAISDISNAAYPEYPGTPDEQRFNDEHRDPRHLWARWVAERGGQLVGFGTYGQFADMYHPRKFWLEVVVPPPCQGQGIGAALYDRLIMALDELGALSVRGGIREDQARAMRFAIDRGFVEDHRAWESRLDPATFDPAPWAALAERVAAQGIEIKTLAELADDPERNRKHYEMFVEVDEDEPRPEPYTPLSYDFFLDRVANDPNLLPDAYFIALHQGEYVGQTSLGASQGNADLYTGLTGVKRVYRRQGIATALKLRAIQYARERGAPVVKTWNDSTNRPMLSINERLGFVKQPAWIVVLKVLREESPAS